MHVPPEITKALTWAASPLGVFTLLSALAVVLRLAPLKGRYARRSPAVLAGAAGVLLILSALPAVADALIGPLETRARVLAGQAPRDGYGYILILGGVLQPPYEGSTNPAELSAAIDRVWLGARLHHQRLAPLVLASGGSPPDDSGRPVVPEAQAMKALLVELGVPATAVSTETRSLNTRQNMRESARLIGAGTRVALVTSAFHMPRALLEARDAGIDAYAFPADFQVTWSPGWPWQRWIRPRMR